MIFSDLIKLVTGYAPELGAALAGPAGGLVGTLVASVFGGSKDNPEELIKRIQTDPEAPIKLKTLEYQHQEELAKLKLNDYQVEVNDRVDARKYGIEYKDFMRRMAYIVTAGFFVALFVLFCPQVNLNTDEKQMMSIVLGMLVGKWQTIIDFFYGSSHKQ